MSTRETGEQMDEREHEKRGEEEEEEALELIAYVEEWLDAVWRHNGGPSAGAAADRRVALAKEAVHEAGRLYGERGVDWPEFVRRVNDGTRLVSRRALRGICMHRRMIRARAQREKAKKRAEGEDMVVDGGQNEQGKAHRAEIEMREGEAKEEELNTEEQKNETKMTEKRAEVEKHRTLGEEKAEFWLCEHVSRVGEAHRHDVEVVRGDERKLAQEFTRHALSFMQEEDEEEVGGEGKAYVAGKEDDPSPEALQRAREAIELQHAQFERGQQCVHELIDAVRGIVCGVAADNAISSLDIYEHFEYHQCGLGDMAEAALGGVGLEMDSSGAPSAQAVVSLGRRLAGLLLSPRAAAAARRELGRDTSGAMAAASVAQWGGFELRDVAALLVAQRRVLRRGRANRRADRVRRRLSKLERNATTGAAAHAARAERWLMGGALDVRREAAVAERDALRTGGVRRGGGDD
ncbi:unnamed protein product, partial [Agarophyton chilense]